MNSVRMATLSMKPGQRRTVADWESSNRLASDTAEHRRMMSQTIRQEGRILRNETTNKTWWDHSDNCHRLSDRIQGLSHWKERLELCVQEVDKEIDALTKVKEGAERALAATATPMETSVECQILREGRQGIELLGDPVESELKKEVGVIDGAQQGLRQRISRAFQQLCLLQEARQQLMCDLGHKMEALDIDTTCLSLTVTSPDISLKPNPLRVPPGSTTPEQWEQFSQYNVSRAQEEMMASLQLREDMSLNISQVQNEIQTQHNAINFALRKRTHHVQQACDELRWQLKTTKDEIAELEQDIRGLERDLQAKVAPIKLVHTRLENRTMRPGVDLCRDEVQYGLVDEAKHLEDTVVSLKDKLSEARHSLQVLKEHQAGMEQDLSRKLDALSLEQRTLETRERLQTMTQDLQV